MFFYRLIALRVLVFMLLVIINSGCSVFGIRTYEMPKYEVILKEGNKEIRYYESHIVARTTVKGEFKDSQSVAFKILAGYIFGDNEKKQKIPMTAPVVQKSTAESEKLQMTAPVIQKSSDEGWVMTFMMPSAYKMEDLPTPKDKRVRLETVPARYIAALRYSWFASERRNDKRANQLQMWLASLKEYEPVSFPMYAGYDPPWTLPLFRRNEMMIQVKRK